MAESTRRDGAGSLLEWRRGRTWYRVVGGHPGDLPGDGEGDGGGGRAPLVLCHGGPGMTHDYLVPLAEALAAAGRPCVLYDQYGVGRSGHRPEAPAGFWTPELFVEELHALADALGLSGGFHLLGHSWGGMLALETALTRPAGLRALVLADTFASSPAYVRGVAGLLARLPAEQREVLARHEAGEPVDPAAYGEAMTAFYRRHVYRAGPAPEALRRTMAAMAEDPTVYRTMMGESEFSMTGSLRDWDFTDRLAAVDLPALVVSGRYDQVVPEAADALYRGLPRAWRLEFGASGHLPHLEEPAAFRAAVEVFLAQVEGTPTP
ncbi:proline iminopeptidase-family hydrolase [Kitasatospora sp. NPDC088783]|uniref:proline iminopeptidase-family hydrolase n=1 Tax=Kitasatospora sp. NPDC088783 TaxID=3364077 RepID=UPI00383089C4